MSAAQRLADDPGAANGAGMRIWTTSAGSADLERAGTALIGQS
ncbi:hypothetical protein ABIB57_000233 [Devosia sp. UYZn731]